jgi:YegS/Rv2252/BmrU family lipid kinase
MTASRGSFSESYYSRRIVKVAAIINPISGAGADVHAAARRTTMVREELDRRGLRGQIDLTTCAGHAHALARRAAASQADLVIVWGGDGTVNEAGAALLDTGTALGLVPAGSGNGLAASLCCHRGPREAIVAALDGKTRAIDAGLLNGRPFFNIAGIGVDARVAQLFNLRGRGSRGLWPYVLLGLREAWRYAALDYEVELDGARTSVRALLIAFANGREYGNGMRLCGQAELDDGLLDATLIEDRPVVSRLLHARHLARGGAERAPRVVTRRIRHAVVRAPVAMQYHVDGEPGSAEGVIEIEVRPGALKVRG